MSYHRAMSCKREFLINAIRNELNLENPHVWAAVHTLVSSAEVPRMRVGFLTVVPNPITQQSTVRYCLTNFQNVRKQLNQDVLLV